MTVNFSSDKMVKIDGIHMDWQANRFITQNGYFFHGAVIEYEHPETGNLTGVAFGQEGLVVVFSNPDGSNKTGRQVMTLVKKLAEENKADVSKGQFPKNFLTDYADSFAIYENGNPSPMFDPEAWSQDLTEEDLADIEARIKDLSYFEESETL